MRLSKSRLSCMALSAMVAAGCVAGATAADWSSAGKDLKNSRYQADEKAISPATAGALQLKWAVNTDGDVTANPAVDGNYIYFPDSAGSLYKVHRITGALAWKKILHRDPVSYDPKIKKRIQPNRILNDILKSENGLLSLPGISFDPKEADTAIQKKIDEPEGEKKDKKK